MRCCKGKFNRFKFGNIAIGFGNFRKTNDTGRGLRVRFNGVGSLVGQLAGSLRDFSADFVGSGSFSADLSNIKQLDVSIAGQGTLTGDLADFVGLLDDYPGAAAAYSVRLLSSTYIGPLVRIRKDTTGQPEKDFYPDSNNELSLNSSDGGTTLGSWIGSNDGYIVTWYDQSGNSNDATQSSASAQPQILSGGTLITQNGKAAIQPDGSDDFLTLGSSIVANTYFISIVAGAITKGRFYAENTGYSNYIEAGSNYRYRINGTIYNVATPYLSSQEVFNWQRVNTDSKIFVNDSQIDAQTVVSSNLTINQLFRSATDSTTCANGLFQEIIQWNVDQTSNRNNINTNINDFFNIYP